MRLRPYFNDLDHEYLEKWISDERVHALWCAGLTAYPVTKENLAEILKIDAREWGGYAYIATEDNGKPVGFFCYSVNHADNSGFLKFIVVDPGLRGKGYGTQMIKLVLHYAFQITGVGSVRINVFDVNPGAKKCYEKAGFSVKEMTEDVFIYQEEHWGRYQMEAIKS